jgi:hypothetical protein
MSCRPLQLPPFPLFSQGIVVGRKLGLQSAITGVAQVSRMFGQKTVDRVEGTFDREL